MYFSAGGVFQAVNDETVRCFRKDIRTRLDKDYGSSTDRAIVFIRKHSIKSYRIGRKNERVEYTLGTSSTGSSFQQEFPATASKISNQLKLAQKRARYPPVATTFTGLRRTTVAAPTDGIRFTA